MHYFEQYIPYLCQIPFIYLLFASFIATFIENIFPPAPSDILAVAIAVVAGMKTEPIWLVVIAAGAGSTLGFYVMFILGKKFEHNIIDANKFRFISRKALAKVHILFRKWGFWLVIFNRFMSGTRVIVSFFAGTADLPAKKTTILSGISSFLWYGILCGVGGYLGKDWNIFYEYVEIYQNAIMITVIALSILILLGFFIWRRN